MDFFFDFENVENCTPRRARLFLSGGAVVRYALFSAAYDHERTAKRYGKGTQGFLFQT